MIVLFTLQNGSSFQLVPGNFFLLGRLSRTMFRVIINCLPGLKTLIKRTEVSRHHGSPIEGPLNPSIPQCCHVRGFSRGVLNLTPLMTRDARLSEISTPDHCSFPSLFVSQLENMPEQMHVIQSNVKFCQISLMRIFCFEALLFWLRFM